jgi:hypothetical protein
MAELDVPVTAQQKLLGENARRLYGIEPLMTVKERIGIQRTVPRLFGRPAIGPCMKPWPLKPAMT